jgi:arabinogalactan endo-1,4-beta-galactosidase
MKVINNKIKSVYMGEAGIFRWQQGVVEIEDGSKYMCSYQYDPEEWKDEADYLDNVKTDFEHQFDIDDKGCALPLFHRLG